MSQALPFFLYFFLFCWKTYLEKLVIHVAGYRKCINKIAPAMYWFYSTLYFDPKYLAFDD